MSLTHEIISERMSNAKSLPELVGFMHGYLALLDKMPQDFATEQLRRTVQNHLKRHGNRLHRLAHAGEREP